MNLEVKIKDIVMKNPVMTASGTFGYGNECNEIEGFDVNKLGAIVTKTITLKERIGNPPPRITETTAGMINFIGLQNIGVDNFIREKLPYLFSLDTPFIVSVGGNSVNDYIEVVKKLNDNGVYGFELNISCPNTDDGMAFGVNAQRAYELVKRVRSVTENTLIVKLTPNVTDIRIIAKAAEEGGADAISLINTLKGRKININKISCLTGGLSGPAIKPVGVFMVGEVYQTVKLPVIGIGGIMYYKDALEYILGGATAVQIGTATFVNPFTCFEVIDDIKSYMEEKKFNSVYEMVGKAL